LVSPSLFGLVCFIFTSLTGTEMAEIFILTSLVTNDVGHPSDTYLAPVYLL
jgi:hypothetical protein